MSIPFTQYLRPDGRKMSVSIERDPVVEAKADWLIAKGYLFECEVLTTGDCSFTIVHPLRDAEGDLAIEISTNRPDVLLAVDRLVNDFYREVKGESKP